MSDDETIPIGEAIRSLEAMGDKLRRTRNERDRYRDWFTKLDAAFVEYIAAVRPILARDPLAAANAKRSAIADERRARGPGPIARGAGRSRVLQRG